MQCLFNPGAAGEGSSIVSVVGAGIFKCFKTAENSLKLLTSPLAKRDPQNFMAHAWLPEGGWHDSATKHHLFMCVGSAQSEEGNFVDGYQLQERFTAFSTVLK